MARNIDWEEPELMEWEDDQDAMRSSDDRCLPGVALITAVGAYAASCRPRYYGCRPRYYYGYGYACQPYYYSGYGYGCRPYYYGGNWGYGWRLCAPRPCRPV